jgi:hypothetical protein
MSKQKLTPRAKEILQFMKKSKGKRFSFEPDRATVSAVRQLKALNLVAQAGGSREIRLVK